MKFPARWLGSKFFFFFFEFFCSNLFFFSLSFSFPFLQTLDLVSSYLFSTSLFFFVERVGIIECGNGRVHFFFCVCVTSYCVCGLGCYLFFLFFLPFFFFFLIIILIKLCSHCHFSSFFFFVIQIFFLTRFFSLFFFLLCPIFFLPSYRHANLFHSSV